MGYLGLIPSEDSSGERRHQGAITKAGTLGWTSSNSLPATKEKALIAQGLIETLVVECNAASNCPFTVLRVTA
jgi:hypothetical protein